MDRVLVELFRHNRWANLRLIQICSTLPDDALQATAPGTYGSVRDTLVHLLGAEQRYVAMLTGQPRPVSLEREPFPGFPGLLDYATRSGTALIDLASSADPDAVLEVPYTEGIVRLRAVVPLIQAINHATEHRSHVVSILTQNGVETTPLDGWTYGKEQLTP